MQNLSVILCEDANDAIKKGYVYIASEFTAVELRTAVVVKNGTVNGNSTVDLVLQDANGKKYVAMITGNLLKSIPL